MQELFKFERRAVVRWLLAVLCGGWLIGATTFVINDNRSDVPIDGSGSYMPYERRLAACNELRGSQAKYDCTSNLMLGRDRNLFSDILIVLLPPFTLIAVAGMLSFWLRLREECLNERLAREAYAAQMNEYRAKRAEEEAEIASGVHKEELFLDDDGNLVEPPAHLARWKENAEAQ